MNKTKPKRRVAVKWRRQHFIVDTVAGLAFVGFLFAGAFWSRAFILAALVVFVVGFTIQRLKFRRCNCETCGAKLGKTMQNGARIEFYCETCNTVWSTNLIQVVRQCPDESHRRGGRWGGAWTEIQRESIE